MVSAGAKAALQGYRLQALYILSRILSSGDPQDFVFQPEGVEDLAIFAISGELIEVIQVKAYGDNLTLSRFEPEKEFSFFRRVLGLAKKHPQIISATCQQASDTSTVMMAEFNSLSPEEKEQRPALTLAIQALAGMVENILPNSNGEGTVKMDLAEAREWLRRLEVTRSQVETVRLLWVADALKIHSGLSS